MIAALSNPTKLRNGLIALGLGAALGLVIKLPFGLDVPNGLVMIYAFSAMASGLTAVALVLMYRNSRIINFAQIPLGALSAQLFYRLYTDNILPFGLAIAAAIIAGIILALVIGTIASMLFFKHPRLVMTVVTLFFVGLIGYIQGQLEGVFVKPGEIAPPQTILGPWDKVSWSVDQIPFRIAHLVGFLMMVLLAVGLVVFFRRTRIGIAVRASAENADRASLLGINVKLLNVFVWALVGFIASVSQVGSMPVVQYNLNDILNPNIILLPLTAAVVARMRHMGVAFFVAAGMLLLDRGVTYATNNTTLTQLGIFGVLMVALFLQRKQLTTRAEEATSWKALKEFRPTPRELLKVSAVNRSRQVLFGLFALVFLGLPWVVSLPRVNSLHLLWLAAIVAMSLVILTGWSGQMSLGQFAIVTMGAFVAGNLALRQGWPFIITLIFAGLAGAVFALIIGLPALRIRGLFLAATTLAIAIVQPIIFFDPDFLGKWVPSQDIERPEFFFLDFADDRSMYYLLMLFFLLAVASMVSLRKSRAGRVLIGMRDNEDGIQAFGVNLVRTRLTAFAVSGFMAGVAGGLLIFQQLGMSQDVFNTQQSIGVFQLVVIGGVSSPLGAFLGAAWFVAGGILFPGLQVLLNGVLGLIVLMFIPGGLAQVFYGVRDAVLRVVAMRQHIVVPSLFADYSPEAWERRLAPLSQPLQSHGLAALGHDQRYRLRSKVFGLGKVEA